MKASIKLKTLLAFLLLILGTSSGLGLTGYILLKQSSVKTEQQKFAILTEHISQDFQTYVQYKLSIMERIVQGKEFSDFSENHRETAINAYFDKFTKEFPVLSFVDEKGRENIVHHLPEAQMAPLDLSTSKIFQTALSFPNKPIVLSITSSPHLKEPALAFILHKRQYFGDQFIGILVGIVPYPTIMNKLVNHDFSGRSFIMAVDPDGVVIKYSANESSITIPDNTQRYRELISALSPVSSKGMQTVNLDGVDTFLAFSRAKNPGWLFFSGQPYDEFMQAPLKLQKFYFILTALIILVGTFLAFLLSRNITTPIIDLNTAIKKVGLGKLDQVVTKKSDDEVGQLVTSFNEMTENLKLTTISRNFVNSILASMNEALIITSEDALVERCNEAAEVLFGYPAAELVGQSIRTLFPPESEVLSLVNGNSKSRSIKHFEAVCLTRQGMNLDTFVTYSSMVATQANHETQANLGIWTFIDITEQKEAEKALLYSQLYLQTIMATMMVGIVVINPETHVVVDCNDAALETLGHKREDVIGRECYNYICPRQQGECPITDLEQEMDRSERVVINKEGKRIPVLKSVKKLSIDGSELLVESFVDISERKKMEEELRKSEAKMRHIAITDELTGLLNRRGFKTLAEQQVNSAKRTNDFAFLLYADLDNLKWINDTLGHETGDQALKETAFILLQTFRKVDIIGRLGGDEFAVLMTDKPQNYDPESIIFRLQRHIDNLNGKTGRQYELSLSIGTVFCDDFSRCNFDDLLSQADSIMYENKMRKKADQNPS